MASFLRKLFGKPSGIEQLARGGDQEALLRTLGEANIFVIAAIEGDGLNPSTMTPEQLLAEIEQAAKDLNERQDGFAPLVYERNGRRRLPFFTSNSRAETFVGEYSKERDRIYPFQLLGVKGSLLAHLLPVCDDLTMNDRTDAEVFVVRARHGCPTADVGIIKYCSGPGGHRGPRDSRDDRCPHDRGTSVRWAARGKIL